MIDPANVPPVESDEQLARFATQSGQFRADLSVKGDLFIPNARGETSVTRLRDATKEEVWEVGHSVARGMGRTLYGRSDVAALRCSTVGLRVDPVPLPDNPNHADIKGWPEAKEDRKAIALKLAAFATKLAAPPSPTDAY